MYDQKPSLVVKIAYQYSLIKAGYMYLKIDGRTKFNINHVERGNSIE